MTNEERKDIITYRIENAKTTLAEVKSHIENGFYNTAVNRMYYACFYAASALLIANKILVKFHKNKGSFIVYCIQNVRQATTRIF